MGTATCQHCNKQFERAIGALNRAKRAGAPLYCGMKCSELGRRANKPKAQRRKEKAEYDKARRNELRDEIREQKRAAYYANHKESLGKHAKYRKKRMPKHVEYCRRPEYKEKKVEYDRKHRAAEYGEFAETYLLLLEVEKEIRSRATSYERRVANGYYTRSAQARRRALCQARNRKTLLPSI